MVVNEIEVYPIWGVAGQSNLARMVRIIVATVPARNTKWPSFYRNRVYMVRDGWIDKGIGYHMNNDTVDPWCPH